MRYIIKIVSTLNQLNGNKRVIISMALLSLIWGAAPIIMKITLLGVDPAFYSLARFVLATILLKIILVMLKNKKKFFYRDKLRLMIMGAILITPYSYLFLIGIQYTSSAVAAMINSTVSVWTLIIVYIFTKRSPSIQCIIGMTVSLLALSLFIFDDLTKDVFSYTENSLFGNSVILLATLCFAYYGFLLKPFEKLGFNSLHIAYYTFLGATTSMTLIFLERQESLYISHNISLVNCIGIVYMALFASVFSYMLHTQNINSIGPHKATIALNFIPIISVFLSCLIGGEGITILHFIASLMLTIGSFLIFRIETYSKNY